MKKTNTIATIIILILLTAATGYNYFFQPFAHLQEASKLTENTTIIATPTPTPDPAIIRLHVTQMISAPLEVAEDASLSAQLEWIAQYNPGFVTLFGNNIATDSAQAVTTALRLPPNNQQEYPYSQRATQETNFIEPLIAVDHEGGSVQRLNGPGFTKLPSWQELCAMTPQRRTQLIETSATELEAAGINIVFAPVLDIASNHPVLQDRVCSSNVEETIASATEYIGSMERFGILPVIKHFPGIGESTLDLHTASDSAFIPYEQVVVFRKVLDRFLSIGVMTTHLVVENQGTGIPCSLSADCITELLITYPGVVIFSDALEMESALGYMRTKNTANTLAFVAQEAVYAGNTVLVFGPTVTPNQLEKVVEQLSIQYQTDPIFAQQVEENFLKITELKRRSGTPMGR